MSNAPRPRGRPPVISAARILAIRQGLAHGLKVSDLARQYGVSRWYVRSLESDGLRRLDGHPVPPEIAALDRAAEAPGADPELVGIGLDLREIWTLLPHK